MRFGLLGSLSVESEGADLTPSRRKEQIVLAALLLRAGEIVATDDLVAAAWGERAPPTAQTALHGHISALRKRLGPARIETRPPGYALRLAAGDELDVSEVERLRAAAVASSAGTRAPQLRAALDLFRGEPLADFRYEAFAAPDAARLEELRLSLLEDWIEAESQTGDCASLLPELSRLVALHPLRERLRGQLVLALYRAGRQADALEELSRARRALAVEIGADPGPALRELERRILDHDPALVGAPIATRPPPEGIVTFLAARPRAAAREGLERLAAEHSGLALEGAAGADVAAFARARDGAAAAAELAKRGAAVSLHSTEAFRVGGGYSGSGMRTAIACAAAAHPGQIVLTSPTRDLLREAGIVDAGVRPLGIHRLADLEPPRPLFQLGVQDVFPPPRGLGARPTNLPVQAPPFVGRERELRELGERLEGGASLVTLTGPGGTGKTRLALHAAAEALDDFDEGVFVVALARVADPELVLPAVGRVLGAGADRDAETLARTLGDRRVLLVLDNFEQVLGAAGVVAALARRASQTAILVTSRAPLRVADETVYPVRPLATDVAPHNTDALLRTSATALFVSRARAAKADFAPTAADAPAIAAICRRLDGLPLAIELAAPRVAVMPPGALLGRLEASLAVVGRGPGRAPRHRTLAAAIGWSYDLLPSAERRLFRGLAVFAGGWTLEAAEVVLGREADVVDGLGALIDASLVTVNDSNANPRFAMLETIREHAAARLDASDERDRVADRHAAYFLDVTEAAEPELRGSPAEWLDRLEAEVGNFRVALDRLDAAGDSQRTLRLAGALWRFWYLRGYLVEGRARLERALQADSQPTPARAKALLGAAVMAINTSDVQAARARAEEALALHELLGDTWGVAYARFMLANALDDPARSLKLYELSVAGFYEQRDEHSALLATRHLAYTLAELGDVAAARTLHEKNLARARATENRRLEASALGALASIALEAGAVDEALELLRASTGVHSEVGDVLDTAGDLYRSAFVLACEGDAATAARLLASAKAHQEMIGSRHAGARPLIDETLRIVRDQLDGEALAAAEREGEAMTLREAAAVAHEALA